MHVNVRGLLRDFARVRRAALAGERVVVTTRDGNLLLTSEPRVESAVETREAVGGAPPVGTGSASDTSADARRFVSRAVINDAVRSAPRIDAHRFRADLDAMIDTHIDG